MDTETRTICRPLNVVLAPRSPASEAYRSEILAEGFEPEPGLDLRFLGGRTLADLRYRLVYLGAWPAAGRSALDDGLAAAMTDGPLNDVLAQYFPNDEVRTTVDASTVREGTVPTRLDKTDVERMVQEIGDGDAVVCLLLPPGAVLADGDVTSEHGLGGYHGSVHVRDSTLYYAAAVYSEGANGILAFDEPWKNVCATLYHELQEVRTDPDVEDAIRAGTSPDAERFLGWYSPEGGEIGDIPMAETHGDISLVMREVPLAAGGTAPIQLMWSNRVDGPEGPTVS
ncbi:MAG TPA: hypothetical protein VFI10_01070 [Gaiellaceae bacterium]|jgi:hypothetical protein|nr:hypothetical protein [Gaiellaceae bacterium]